jgi:hypothetical protein
MEKLDNEIKNIVNFIELEKQYETSASYMDCFRGTDFRRTMIATLSASGQQLVGIAFISG